MSKKTVVITGASSGIGKATGDRQRNYADPVDSRYIEIKLNKYIK
jgi:short-subunit dehydrogenase involved in D-alanine esterification of teichoic acids